MIPKATDSLLREIVFLCTVNIVLEVIKYRWIAKGRHGTHSPFVYAFTDECQRIPMDVDVVEGLKRIEATYTASKEIIDVNDQGVGSHRLSHRRLVKDIYRVSSSKGKFGRLLFQISRYYSPKKILEFGTSLGVGTYCLAKGNPGAEVVSIDACRETQSAARHMLEGAGIENCTLINATFDHYLSTAQHESFDFVFIDGHHDGEALLRYLSALKPLTHSDTIFILDDIRWSASMFEAWQKIIDDSDYHVTMDFFRMGMILRRPQQRKEHFVVKV
jgi:predicted O-methyltransferase YrrM